MTKTKTEVEVSFLTYQLTRSFWLLDFPTTNTSKNKNGTEVEGKLYNPIKGGAIEVLI